MGGSKRYCQRGVCKEQGSYKSRSVPCTHHVLACPPTPSGEAKQISRALAMVLAKWKAPYSDHLATNSAV